MSEQAQGPGWWQASDGRWYPPEAAPGQPTAPPSAPVQPPPGSWGSSATPPAWGAPPPGYGYAYAPGGPSWGPPPLPSVNGLAIASLVLGIIGAVPCFWNGFLSIPALIMGIIAVRKINRGDAAVDGKGMAIAGIVLGAIGTALVVLLFLLLFAGEASSA